MPPRFQCDESTPAVLILGKPPFASDALPSLLNAGTKLEKTFRNDVYYKFDAMPDPRANLLKAQGSNSTDILDFGRYFGRLFLAGSMDIQAVTHILNFLMHKGWPIRDN